MSRARRRQKLTKAIERRARKLRAKGITVDLDELKSDYISQRRGQNFNFSDSDEDPIDVVGVCASEQVRENLLTTSSKSNPFSIENLLSKNS